VIKDVIKDAHYIFVARYYTQLNLLLLSTQMFRLFFFTLTCKCISLLHVGVEAGDEAHPGPQDLSDQGAAPSGASQLDGEGSIDMGLALWLLGIRPI
jgi:hypothetical protein